MGSFFENPWLNLAGYVLASIHVLLTNVLGVMVYDLGIVPETLLQAVPVSNDPFDIWMSRFITCMIAVVVFFRLLNEVVTNKDKKKKSLGTFIKDLLDLRRIFRK